MTWIKDLQGIELDGPDEAFRDLRSRAQRAIRDGDERGLNVRASIVRLSDEAGSLLFEGTLENVAIADFDGEKASEQPKT